MVRREHDPEHTAHQPESAHDSVKHPPKTDLCRRIRGMLRDFVDGDLEPGFEREVEDHVHECRGCDLALSRAEFEVLRLRAAFADDVAAAHDLPDDFASRVRARVEDEAGGGAPSPDFTRVVMERVDREWRKPSLRERLPRRRWVAAAAVITALVIGWSLVPDESTRAAAYLTAKADGVRILGASGEARAFTGEGPVFAHESLHLDREGRADVRVTSPQRSVDRGVIELDGPGALAFHEASIALVAGAARVLVEDGLTLDLLAATQVLLTTGEFDLEVASRERFDSGLARERLRSVRLEVLAGQAIIVRGGVETVVQSGFVASFGDWRPIEIEPGITDPMIQASVRNRAIAREGLETRDLWTGRVVDERTGLGVAGAKVSVRLGGGRPVQVATDLDGAFELPASDATLGVVAIEPPSGAGLDRRQAQPVRLPARGGDLGALHLSAPIAFWGLVEDREGQPVRGARVVPYVLDQVLDLCDAREDLAASTGVDGRFDLAGLPRDLEPQQVIALVIEHEDHPTTAYREVDANRSIGRPFRLDRGRDIVLSGLPANRSLQIVQGVPGLPMAQFAVRREVVSDGAGRARMRGVGSGRLWFHDRESRNGVPLVATVSERGEEFLARFDAEHCPSFADVPVGDGPIARRSGQRFAAFRAAPLRSTTLLTVIDRDSVVVPGTRLFLIDANGRAEFLGEYSGSEAFRFAAPDGPYSVVAIGPDGSVGWRSTADLSLGHNSIRMEQVGAVEFDVPQPELLDPAIDRTAVVRFRMLEGALAGREFWRVVRLDGQPRVDDLMPGSYVVEFDQTDARLLVEVTGDGTVEVGLPIGVELTPR